MKALFVLISIVAVVFIIITIHLFLKVRFLNGKLKYVDDANRWHKLAITDSLTGVYNRNAYDLRMSEIKNATNKESQGILIFDVDDFKIFNDKKGHLAGDEVLKMVAQTLLAVFPEPKYSVFRIGGDEFSVLSENTPEKELIHRLIVLKKRLEANGDIRLSKGYSIIKDNPEESFKFADEMLYADKLSKN